MDNKTIDNQSRNEAIDEMQKWFEWLIDEEINSCKGRIGLDTLSEAERMEMIEILQELKRKVRG